MSQISWTDALTSKPAIKNALQDILDQVPTDGGGRDAIERCLDALASYVNPTLQLKADKFDALIDNGVDSWSGYDEAMEDFYDDDED